jgi:carboxyl-terminal processing protease
MRAAWMIILILLFLAACVTTPSAPVSPTVTVPPTPKINLTPTPGISPEAARYLNDALDIMQNHSINKHKIDWPTFRANILKTATFAHTPEDTYPSIRLALSRLNDHHHSHFINPRQASVAEKGTGPTPMPPELKLVENKFGYVTVPAYGGLNQDLINQYGTDMQKHIAEIDRQNPCGWIVDLRENTGGNVWPMLIGIGPILGEGKTGSSIDADGNQIDHAYLEGKGMYGNDVGSEVIGAPYHIANPDAPVAVLFGNRTASSGEMIVISFIGRRNTRSFGSNSAGYTTSNEGFKLSDQAIIFLTTAVAADRTGKVYGDVIIPDVITEGNNNRAGPIPEEALQWLGDQPACQ